MNFSDIRINKADHFTLDNGLKTVYYIDHSNPIVCVQLHIKTGSIYENEHQRGFSHFIEHLAFKSTAKYPMNSISDLIPQLGGMINAYTDFDSTCYYILLPKEHFTKAVEILSELAFAASFTEEDVVLEKDIVIEEIKQYENEPEVDFIEFIQGDYFTNNPMKYPVLGSVSAIKSITYKHLRNFYETHYTPDNSFLVFSGDIESQQIMETVNQYFYTWNTKTTHLPDFAQFLEPEIPAFKSTFRAKKKSSTFLAFVVPELSDRHADSNEMLIAMRLLAIGKSSRLYRRLVEKEKLCSSVRVSSLSGILSGASVIHLTPSRKNSIERIASIFFDEFLQILSGNIKPEEFELVKLDVLNSWLYGFESMESAASTIAADELNGDYKALYSYPEAIAKMSLSDVLEKLIKYWNQNSMRIYYQDTSHQHEHTFCQIHAPVLEAVKPLKTARSQQGTYKVLHDKDYHNSININILRQHDKESIYEFGLSSGLRVVYKQQNEKQICGIALSSDISQLMESNIDRGLNYLCSTSMLYGSQFQSYDQIQNISRRLGFSMRVSHHLDSTSFRAKCFSDDLSKVLEILSQIVLYPAFPTKHISMIRSNAIDNLRREKQYPISYAYKEWQKLIFGKNNNLDNATGSITSLSSLTKSQVLEWHTNWSVPDQFVLCIIGDKSVEDVFNACERFFGHSVIPKLETQRLLPRASFTPLKSRKKIHKTESEQAIVNLGGYGCPATDMKSNTAFHLLSQVIGGDINSRMFCLLREKYGYAYQTGFDFTSIAQMGFWNAYIYCDPDDYKDSLRLTKDIIKDVRENGITALELETAKNYLIGMHRFDAESVSWQASTISNLLCLGYDLEHFLSRENRIRNISTMDIAEVANEWLQEDNFFTHILL